MKTLVYLYLICALLLMPSVMFAQDQTPLPPAVDTTIVVEGITDTAYGSNIETSYNTRFDTLTGIATVQVRKIPDSVIRRLQNNEDYWYAQQPPPRQEQKKKQLILPGNCHPGSGSCYGLFYWVDLFRLSPGFYGQAKLVYLAENLYR